MINPYKVLGVKDNAPTDECKKAYRILSRKYHPDNNGDANLFDQVQKAWQMISEGYQQQSTLLRNSLKFTSLFNFRV